MVRVYYKYALQILETVRAAHQEIENTNKEISGKLTITAPSSINRKIMSPIITDFLNKYPKIQLSLYGLNSPETIIDNDIDIAISNINLVDKNIIKTPFITLTRSLFASPKYLKRKTIPKKIEDLKDHDCLINIKESPDLCWSFNKQQKIKVNARYIADTTDSIIAPAIEGLGIIWISKEFIQEELKNNLLAEINIPESITTLALYIYYKPCSINSKKRIFTNYLKNAL